MLKGALGTFKLSHIVKRRQTSNKLNSFGKAVTEQQGFPGWPPENSSNHKNTERRARLKWIIVIDGK